jgi:hypothetical protein
LPQIKSALRGGGGLRGVGGTEAEFLQRGYEILTGGNSIFGGQNGLGTDVRGVFAGELSLALHFGNGVEALAENVAERAAGGGDYGQE